MSKIKKDYLLIFFSGCIIGIISFIAVYGVKVLNFTYDDWLLQGTGQTGDLTQHYLGWVFLRDSKWSFPLCLIEGLSYPERISAVYTDSIPLFALIFKIFSPVLPKTFQYFGLWGIMCFALQGGISAIIIRKFTENKAVCLISSLFFIFSPIVFKRMFFHTALAAHWIILAAICIWVYREHFKSLKIKLPAWCVLTALTVLTNLYFTPIVIGIMLCSFLQDLIEDKKILHSIIVTASSFVTALAVMFIFGGFYGGVNSRIPGLGGFSFNLNSFYNSQGTSYFMNGHPLASGGQNEGYAYLGLGMMFALAVAIFIKLQSCSFKKPSKKDVLAAVPYITAIFVFTVLACSPVVTFNLRTLFTIPYPESVYNALAIFRSSARFIWPVYYMIFINVISVFAKLDKQRVSIICLAAFVIIQLIDLKDIIISNRNFFSSDYVYSSTLKSGQWEAFAEKYEHIMFYAPLWDLYVNPDIAYNFAVYAKENDMTINGTYFSRDYSDKIDPITREHFEMLKNNQIKEDNTLYIFPTNKPEGDYGLKYYQIDGYTVGIKK